MSIQQEKFTQIADAIREKTGTTDTIKPSDFASKVSDVYDAGKEAENKAFWENFVYENDDAEYGGRISYGSAFLYWQPEQFKPTKTIRIPLRQNNTLSSMSAAFKYFGYYTPEGTEISLPELLSAHGGGLDLKWIFDLRYMFQNSNFTDLGTLSLPTQNGQYIRQMFDGCTRLRTLTLADISNSSLTYTGTFQNCTSLTDLYFENSVISQNIDLQYSPLCKASIVSVINALSSDATGMTVIFSLEAVNKAFETSEGAADGSESFEWDTGMLSKSNWTFSLV